MDYCRQFLQSSKTPMLDLKSWLRRNLTSTSESFFVPPPCCWIAWTREERLSKVWEAGGHLSFRADTRTIRCWGQVRGRRRSMRTLSQQSFSLFSFSCSTNTSRLSSSCSSLLLSNLRHFKSTIVQSNPQNWIPSEILMIFLFFTSKIRHL